MVIALLVSGGIITRYRHNRVEVVHAAEIFRDASIAGEDGAEAVERRRDFARRVEQSYRDEGKEFVITVQGDDATGLHMQSAEIDPVWKHQVSENYGLQTTLKDLGFNWLEATNGGDFSGHWDLE